MLIALEDTIVQRVPDGEAILETLTSWQTNLIHIEPEVKPQDCLICWRARRVPQGLPARYTRALRVIHDAA